MNNLALTPSEAESFWARVEKTPTCWNWTGPKTKGYGQLQSGAKRVYAHRVSYQMVHGHITSGQFLDHTCHNRACVNPSHLRIVTNKQNCENRHGAQRNSKSGIRGVTWASYLNKWRADVTHNKKQYNLGYFETIEEAEAVVVAKRNELYTHNVMDRKQDAA